MERAIIVRGRLAGPLRIELDEPIEDLEGDVEIVVRRAPSPAPVGRDFFDVIAGLPSGSRSKDEIDAELAAERGAWGEP